jgi:hypothetical protein
MEPAATSEAPDTVQPADSDAPHRRYRWSRDADTTDD